MCDNSEAKEIGMARRKMQSTLVERERVVTDEGRRNRALAHDHVG